MICEEPLPVPVGTWGGQLPRAFRAAEDGLPLGTVGWSGSCAAEPRPVAEDTWEAQNQAFWGARFGLTSRADGLQPRLAGILSLVLGAPGVS